MKKSKVKIRPSECKTRQEVKRIRKNSRLTARSIRQ